MTERIALAGLTIMVLGIFLVVGLGFFGLNFTIGVVVFLFGGCLTIATILVDLVIP